MKIVVVGAGIVGLATAYELVKAGYSVRVIEKNNRVGQGASGGNGAQLSYSYVQPLAEPSIWAQLPTLLFAKNSPLSWKPSLHPQQWRWLIAFMKACTQGQSRRGTQTLLALGALSRQRFETMLVEQKLQAVDLSYQQNGKLVLYRSDRSYTLATRQLALQKDFGDGGQQFAISAAQALALEPNLEGSAKRFVGAIHTSSECVIDCQKLCDALAVSLQQMGVEFSMNSDTIDVRQPNTCWIICAGAQSFEIARSLRVRVPIYPLKGYSITVPIAVGSRLKMSVTDAAKKIVFAPLGSGASPSIRVAGFAELVGADLAIDRVKIQKLLEATQALFPYLAEEFDAHRDWERLRPWAGLRPATPTGIPIIGRVAGLPNNVLVNIGHGALGLTLAFGSAYRLSQLIAGQR
jgi:D-amino-acid dehydrogenase